MTKARLTSDNNSQVCVTLQSQLGLNKATMDSKNMCKSAAYIIIAVMLMAQPIYSDDAKQNFSSTVQSSQTSFEEYRYNRYILFFFSEDVTLSIFSNSILPKLIELDTYCGGENIFVNIFLGTELSPTDACAIFCTFNASFEEINYHGFNASIAHGVKAGSVDRRDVNNVTATIFNQVLLTLSSVLNGKYGIEKLETQVILVTDYASDSLISDNFTAMLADFKLQKNVSFIALTSDLDVATARQYFPTNMWSLSANYKNWTSEVDNPICAYRATQYTTPLPSFDDNFVLNIYLFFSNDYLKTTQLKDTFDFLIRLTERRWLDPCRQYRYVSFKINYNIHNDGIVNNECLLDSDLIGIDLLLHSPCSLRTFELFFGTNASLISSGDSGNAECPVLPKMLSTFFNDFMQEKLPEKRKYLLITDLPMLCDDSYFIDSVYKRLESNTDYFSGAPLTVVAVGNKTDAKSSYYPSIFPPTQRSNFYEVDDMTYLLSNINNTINFCVNWVPWLVVSQSEVSSKRVVWYFYLIGAFILTALLALIGVIFLNWRRKRLQHVRQIRERAKTNSSSLAAQTATRRNTYQQNWQMSIVDPWEVSLTSLDVDYRTPIGKGAFSVVYSGFLRDKAPVLKFSPSIALQQFSDCMVAVKTLPQHSTESDKAKFRSEVRLMKEIGYHVHLVSMLGCNCSVERPFLLLELADQDLLRWLISARQSPLENDSDISKTLLSVAWQISDGMDSKLQSYLSSKRFLHRDLAARNVLVTKEMKAMVSDFGLCQKLNIDEEERIISGERLPLKWIAFESLLEKKFSTKTDIWSFGVLLFEIFSLGQEPYMKISSEELVMFLQEGNRLDRPQFANDLIFDLMKQCWQTDPMQRPAFTRISAYFASMLEDSAANYGYLMAVEETPQRGQLSSSLNAAETIKI